MSSFDDSSHSHSLLKRTLLVKGVVRPAILSLQKKFGLGIKNFCLITGAPRSGTTAVSEWLGHQRAVLSFQESRILVSIHRFMEEIDRFQNLHRNSAVIAKLASRLVCDYYSTSNTLIGKRLVVEKEPLEPTAFPAKDYHKFIVNCRTVFPHSKLLFVIRDPMATIWSMSSRRWGESLVNQEAKDFTLDEYIENWCSCVELILSYQSDSNSYIVPYGRLVKDPQTESGRICDFLKIRYSDSFQPRQTKEIGFSDYERGKIMLQVQPQLDLLASRGILS